MQNKGRNLCPVKVPVVATDQGLQLTAPREFHDSSKNCPLLVFNARSHQLFTARSFKQFQALRKRQVWITVIQLYRFKQTSFVLLLTAARDNSSRT